MSFCCRILAAIVCIFTTTACLEQERVITLNPDGSGKLTVHILADISAFARVIQAKGAVAIPKEAKLQAAQHMLLDLINQHEGIDCWASATTDLDEKGMVHLNVTGYFKDINHVRLHDKSPSMVGGMPVPQPGAIGGYASKVQADGTWLIEARTMTKALPQSQGEKLFMLVRPTDTSKATVDLRAKEDQGNYRVTMSMFGKVQAARMFLKETLIMGGTLVEHPGFAQVDPKTVTTTMQYEKLVPVTDELMKDEEFVKSAVRRYDNFWDGMLVASVTDQKVVDKVQTALRGDSTPPRLLLRAGGPVFDYTTEFAAAQAAQPPELKAALEELQKARAQWEKQQAAPKKKR